MRPVPDGGSPADVQAADSGFDLLARGRKAQAPGFDIPNPIEDEACLIRVQLAHLQRHDSPGTIGEDAEEEPPDPEEHERDERDGEQRDGVLAAAAVAAVAAA